jgi:hypothetical protein
MNQKRQNVISVISGILSLNYKASAVHCFPNATSMADDLIVCPTAIL